MANGSSFRRKYNRGYKLGSFFAVLALAILFLPTSNSFIAAGPVLVGHEQLDCIQCHKSERGSLRQQLQANVQYLLGNRKQPVSVGYRPVLNKDCLSCHKRPNDRHPVYRFYEPKYREVRQNIGAHQCVACHREHQANRVSVKLDFCMHCHDELQLKNDPVDTSHEELVQNRKWETCLGCHDFHGNHKMKPSRHMADLINSKTLMGYFSRDKHPYPGKIIHKAKKSANEK